MKQPFYRQVVCNKVLGGIRPLWQARLTNVTSNLCGAGGSADLAIADLQKQLRNRRNPIQGSSCKEAFISASRIELQCTKNPPSKNVR